MLITLADVYKLVVSLAARVDTALSKHEAIERVVAEHDQELRPLAGAADRLTDHEARLRTLERSRWPLASLTVLFALGSLVLAAIALYVKK